MSRVAKKPVPLPKGVTAAVSGDSVSVKGAKGSLSLALSHGIKVVQEEQTLLVSTEGATVALDAAAGSTRAHLANMVTGGRRAPALRPVRQLRRQLVEADLRLHRPHARR